MDIKLAFYKKRIPRSVDHGVMNISGSRSHLGRMVSIHLRDLSESQHVRIEVSPAQARELARTLLDNADFADGELGSS